MDINFRATCSIEELYSAAGLNKPFSDSFDCHRFEDIASLVKPAMPAHRNMFNGICLLTGGELLLQLNDQSFSLHAGTLLLVGAGHIVSWKIVQELRGYVVLFTDQYFCLNLQRYNLLSDFPFLMDGEATLLAPNPSQQAFYTNVFQLIIEEQRQQSRDMHELIRSYLLVLLLKSKREFCKGKLLVNSNKQAGRQTVIRFQALINQHLQDLLSGKTHKQKQTSEYAKELNIHPNYLNETVQKVLGKTAGKLVRERIMQEAAVLLLQTEFSISEIAYLLGFDSAAYFSRFFRRETGYTPSDYRNTLKL